MMEDARTGDSEETVSGENGKGITYGRGERGREEGMEGEEGDIPD